MMLVSRDDSTSAARLDDKQWSRPGFTLVELLVTISIIGVLASLVLVGLAGVQETARADRTRAQIAKIDSLIGDKWESFRTRRLPLVVPPTLPLNEREMRRVEAMRTLMMQEMPERKREVRDFLPGNQTTSSLWLAYRRAARRMLINKHRLNETSTPRADSPQFSNVLNQYWSIDQESAECLYLIISQIMEDDQTALEFFPERERADVDNDGMPEIIDAWGTPIRFLRRAPGITPYEPAPPGIAGTPQDSETPDPMNPRQLNRDGNGIAQVDQRVRFALFPLVCSAGSDKGFDLAFGTEITTSQFFQQIDPYYSMDNDPLRRGIGFSRIDVDLDNDGKFTSADNISNHSLYAK